MGEDAVVAGGVAGGQGAEGAQQVGDGAPADGQDGGEGEQDEAAIGRAREGRFQGVEDGADRLGELLVDPFELASRRTGLSGLLASQSTEPLPDCFRDSRGRGRSVRLDHGGLLGAMGDPVHNPHCTEEARRAREPK